MKNQIIYKLDGLCCPNCAMKIESKVNKLDEIKEASINFALQTITIDILVEVEEHILKEKVTKIAKEIEPEVEVYEYKINSEKRVPSHSYSHKKEEVIEEEGCGCGCSCGSHSEPVEKEKKDVWYQTSWFRFGMSAILFLIPFVLELPTPIELVLYLGSYLISGWEVLATSAKNIKRLDFFDENFLMTIATIGAFAIGNYPEGVAVMLFYQIGEMFQDYAVNKSRSSITSLMDIRPDAANKLVGEEIQVVSPQDVVVGDIILVKPGEKVPLDGKVIGGKSMVDTSALTGESVPRDMKEGDNILSGFVNKNGVLTIEVEKEYSESTISKILELVENATNRKAKTEKFITKFARVYTPIVTITALLLAIVPPILISGATFSDWLYRALVFLVISCPCALVISIPLGFFGGIGGASKLGVLVKGANYLEVLNKINIVVFDKTGTLTKGIFEVSKVVSVESYRGDQIIKYAAYGESYSNHPIGEAIRRYYKGAIVTQDIKEYEELPGMGIKAVIEGKEVYLGNQRLLNVLDIKKDNFNEFGTVVHVVIERNYAGYILISDEIKEDAKETIAKLKKQGKTVVMLTGDNKLVGDYVGKELGIDTVYADLLPQDKVTHVEQLKEANSNNRVMFVGDGVNDAPVLALSDVGVAMGGLGSDAAIEAADVVLMTDEPKKLLAGFVVANKTKKIVWENIIIALGIKLVFLILGAFGIASMWEAVFADVGVALLAVLNAMRVMKVREY